VLHVGVTQVVILEQGPGNLRGNRRRYQVALPGRLPAGADGRGQRVLARRELVGVGGGRQRLQLPPQLLAQLQIGVQALLEVGDRRRLRIDRRLLRERGCRGGAHRRRYQ